MASTGGWCSKDGNQAWPWHSPAEEGPLLPGASEKVTEEPEAAVSEARTQSDSDAHGCSQQNHYSCFIDEETEAVMKKLWSHTLTSYWCAHQVKCQRFTPGRFTIMWNNRLSFEKKDLNKPMESLESFQACSKWMSALDGVAQSVGLCTEQPRI